MAEYRLGERAYDGDDPDLQFALKAAHGGDVRPLCLCRQFDAMLPMVIEHRAMNGADLYLLRRMPGQGHLHTPACRHYEAPEGLSGRADHLGAAIKTEDEGAHHKLRLGFPLSHQERVASEDDAVEPKAPARLRQLYARLSLTGFLHHILETAELNKMHKGLHDKRGWAVMRGRILEAMASQSTARYRDLADYAFCPRVFSVERKDELFRDWRAIERKAGAEKRAIILFAELKDIDGGQLIFKHLPQRAFAVKPDIQKPFLDTLDQITGLMTGPRGAGHVLCCALVTVGEGDVLSIADIAMVATTAHWIAFGSMPDYRLLTACDEAGRSYFKSLDYGRDNAVASLVLTDTGDAGTAVFLIDEEPTKAQEAAMKAVAAKGIPVWRCDIAEGRPSLPPRRARQAPPRAR